MPEQTNFIQSAAPFLGILSQVIGWGFFLMALGMFKNFISKGFSMAIAEYLLKVATNDQRQKIARWFADGDLVLESLQELDEKLAPGEGRKKA